MTVTQARNKTDLLIRKAQLRDQLRDMRTQAMRQGRSELDPEQVELLTEVTGEIDRINVDLSRLDTPMRSAYGEGTYRVGQPGSSIAERTHPLAYTPESLDAIQEALVGRRSGRFEAGMQERAALQTSTFGAPRAWGANVLDGPRLLHVAAGVPQQPVDAVAAQLPTLTLPTASASVAETVTLGEYAASTAGAVTLARFGRFTDLSREAMVGTNAGTIVAAHTVGVALDLDNALISLVNTAAGSAVAFTSDVPAAIRKSIAVVTAATAAANASDVVVMAHTDNVALLESVTPIGGQSIGEGFSLFSGALVYASNAVPTGFMLVGNLAAGVRYFEAVGLTTETDSNIKTGVFTAATSIISGYGNALAGYVQKIDVVTP